jgi:hypothetical protein
VFPALFIYLIFIKFSDDVFYKKLTHKQITLDELAGNFERYNNDFDKDDDLYLFYWIEAQLIIFYRNYFNHNKDYDHHIKKLVDTENKLLFKSTVKDRHLLENGLIRSIVTINEHYKYSHLSLSHLLDKIELIEDFKLIDKSETNS